MPAPEKITVTVTDRDLITVVNALMFYAAKAIYSPNEVQAAALIAQMVGAPLPYARPDEINDLATRLAKAGATAKKP